MCPEKFLGNPGSGSGMTGGQKNPRHSAEGEPGIDGGRWSACEGMHVNATERHGHREQSSLDNAKLLN